MAVADTSLGTGTVLAWGVSASAVTAGVHVVTRGTETGAAVYDIGPPAGEVDDTRYVS